MAESSTLRYIIILFVKELHKVFYELIMYQPEIKLHIDLRKGCQFGHLKILSTI
jgi:hypothetical protein